MIEISDWLISTCKNNMHIAMDMYLKVHGYR